MLSEVLIGTRTRWALVAGFEIVLDSLKIMRSHDSAQKKKRRPDWPAPLKDVMNSLPRRNSNPADSSSFCPWDLRLIVHHSSDGNCDRSSPPLLGPAGSDPELLLLRDRTPQPL